MIKIKKMMLKPAILSISMATVMAGAAISPGLGLIAQAFPQASQTTIKLVLTAPSLMIIPFSFISSYLTSFLRKKTIALLGLFIYVIGGILPQFMSSIELILAFRLLLGVGVGLIMPLDASLINDYYSGKERTSVMGYNSAFSNFSGIITMLIAGWLATFSWRLPFNVYLLGVPVILLVFFFLPKGEIHKPTKQEKKLRIPASVYIYALAMCGFMLAYYSIASNMALFLEQNELGGAALAGMVVSLTTVGGMITSLLIVRIEQTFKSFVVPIMLLGMGLGFFFLTWTKSIPLIMLSVALVGFGQGVLFPVLTLKALDCVPLHQVDLTASIVSSFIFLGQFLSPIVLDGIGLIAGKPSIRFQYGVLTAVLAFVILAQFISIIKEKEYDKAKSIY